MAAPAVPPATEPVPAAATALAPGRGRSDGPEPGRFRDRRYSTGADRADGTRPNRNRTDRLNRCGTVPTARDPTEPCRLPNRTATGPTAPDRTGTVPRGT
ncbi:hypothetical protein GCM10009677_22680 [Sphaerisporangium rubeum]